MMNNILEYNFHCIIYMEDRGLTEEVKYAKKEKIQQ